MVYKILVFPVPYAGHTNPMIKIVNELIKTCNAKVIVYTIENFKNQIESINAEFRLLEGFSSEAGQKPFKNIENSVQSFKEVINGAFLILDKFTLRTARIIEEVKPDLVLFDSFAGSTKLALEILNNNYKNRERLIRENRKDVIIPTSPAPMAIAYWTTFINQKDVYPNEIEQKVLFEHITNFEKLQLIIPFLMGRNRINKFCKGLDLESFKFEDLMKANTNILNIVLIFPELHPRAHLFDKKVLFVGPCITDEIHVTGIYQSNDPSISELLNKFPIINPSHLRKSNITNSAHENDNSRTDEGVITTSNKKLIYVSLGTILNENARLYSIVLDAFKNFDVDESTSEKTNKTIKLNDITILFSLGKQAFEHFKKLDIPENIILKQSVPQLEVLKRASLFITHSGMNSTSESVHYGVPMICIPLMGDQPTNAFRIAVDLGLGVKFNFKTVTSVDIKLAVNQILNDQSFYERCSVYSSLSATYNGQKTSAEIIINEIEKTQKSN